MSNQHTELIKALLKAADEISDEGHQGWGNVCADAAFALQASDTEVEALAAENARLADALADQRCISSNWRGQVDRLKAQPASAAASEGWTLVPIDPTNEMIVALMCTGLRHAEYKQGCDPAIAHLAQGYTAMLSAAPQIPVSAKPMPLTDEQVKLVSKTVYGSCHVTQDLSFARAIEAAHGIAKEPS